MRFFFYFFFCISLVSSTLWAATRHTLAEHFSAAANTAVVAAR